MGHRHQDALAYIFIAIAIIIAIRAFIGIATITQTLLYLAIAVALLASNVPRVVDIPIHYVRAIRNVGYFSFCIAIICFFVICMHYLLLPHL